MRRPSVLFASAVLGFGCAAEDPGRLPAPSEGLSVEVSSEQRAPVSERFAATVVSERSAEIATRMSGTVERVATVVGARVTEGEPLVLLDDSEVEAQLEAARAGLLLQERSHERIANLAAAGAASQQELEESQAALTRAQSAFRSAEAQVAYAVVRAPFDGVVVTRSVDPGDLAVPGRPLLTMVAADELKVVAELPAHRLGTVAVGQEVAVEVDGVPGVLTARVDRTVPALGAGSRTFRVEATIFNIPVGVRPGAFARITLAGPGEGPRWIPADAVVERGQLTGVFSVENDTLRVRWLRLGQRTGEAVEVLAGPNGALTVVRRPGPELRDGLPVSSVAQVPWAAMEASHGAEAAPGAGELP